MPRLVVPDYPHHVTQRGARRQPTFFSVADYQTYIALLSAACRNAGVEFWAYCLMPNHVHFVAVPKAADSLAKLFGEAHRRYTRQVNARHDWRGHLWQERFHSFVMDESHLLAAVRYVELNPVRADLCIRPEDWEWSSARAHLTGTDDALVTVGPMLSRIGDWRTYLSSADEQKVSESIRRHSRSGRPAGNEAFVSRLEDLTGRSLHRAQAGRKPAVCEEK